MGSTKDWESGSRVLGLAMLCDLGPLLTSVT